MHYFRTQWLKQNTMAKTEPPWKIIKQIKSQNIGKLLQVTVTGYLAVGSN